MREAWKEIVLVMTLRCEEAERIRLRRDYGEATRAERLAEFLHRTICGPCKVVARQQRRLTEAIAVYRQRALPVPPPPGGAGEDAESPTPM